MTEEKPLKLIGYWAGNEGDHMNPYPYPSYLVDSKFWEEKGEYVKGQVVEYLDGCIEVNCYRGLSPC